MKELLNKLFICFAAKDRYDVVQPIVYHLKNYGIDIWYDRYEMVMGDNRFEKNIEEGAGKCRYALIVLSHNTINSLCATEEIAILEERYYKNEVIIFPVLFKIKPSDVPSKFQWVKDLIFKEVLSDTGTLEVANHIACKITKDILAHYRYKNILDILSSKKVISKPIISLLKNYTKIDVANLNSRVALLFAVYTIIVESHTIIINEINRIPIKVFDRLFTETCLNLSIDYRELWLLENSICILIQHYYMFCTESKI